MNLSEHEQILLKLRMIDEAQGRGATWASIAQALGYPNGKTLKNETKKIARQFERQLRSEEGR